MYQAVLIVSFGGPEKPEDVFPFLENVTRGRNIPHERLLEVAGHYHHLGGKSPINDQCRELIAALRTELDAHGTNLPIYWGNRNWHPFLADTLKQMRDDGITNALAFMTSAYSSYSGCRQYRENIVIAQAEVGEGVPKIEKLRAFYNHPGFIQASAARVRQALREFSTTPYLVVTAHSIPCSMAATSDYEKQLRETARLVADAVGLEHWNLVYQSRSGPPSQPWLGPDILDHLRALHRQGIHNVIAAPLGFLSDHVEVLYDLDSEARELAADLKMNMVRAATVGTHPAFIRMIRQLICERMNPAEPKLSVGLFGPNHDVCPVDCCPAPQRAGRLPASEVQVVSPQP
ncbi:MAG: ferrochelatase [Acidobacteriota bacterium]|nr:ferrochelatase [Acidobacteriota bacterium]